jgi:uncharacterized membrane protein YdjX (TVP38/TMEM64 family)
MSTTPEQRKGRAKSPVPTAGGDKKDDATKDGDKKGAASGKSKMMIIGAVAVVVLAGVYWKFGQDFSLKESLEAAVRFVEAQGQTAVIWYCAFTLLGVVCLVPTTPMEIAGGFLFSPIYGIWAVCVFTGISKLTANCISVLIARFVVKDWVMKNVVAKNELLTMVSQAVKEEPWKMAFLVRGSMVPLFVKNYGLGVMDIGYLPNACCSMIFTNFYACQNIYMGSAMQDLKEVFAPKTADSGPTDYTAYAKKLMPVAFNILLVVFLVKAVKQQMTKQKAQIEKNLKEKNANKKD